MPRLLAVDPEMLARRESFTFTAAMPPHNRKEGWKLLNAAMPDGAVPAVADSNTLTWALGRKVGDTVPYVDEQGRPFNLRIVGVIASSILQGGLIVAERQFLERFPSISGYNVILVNAPASAAEAVREELQRGLADLGVDLESAPRRLMDFAEVENTYLSIFAVLGGLGLLLGSVGLGVLVLRNVLERRSELALLRAVGFTRPRLRWLVLSEHIMLLALGLGAGSAAALVAVIPALSTPAAEVPYASLSITLAAVVAMGVLWTLGATVLALRGPLMQALRNE
jgi:predicted lysophospholipase L1 biosynthesis ABC-type transport system permease subunit